MATRFQRQRAVRRRTSDITRLTGEYQRDVANLANQFDTEFARYQQQVADTMAPFESAMRDYQNRQQPEFASQMSAYQSALGDYERQLKSVQDSPLEKVNATFATRIGTKGSPLRGFMVDGNFMRINERTNVMPNAYAFLSDDYVVEGKELYKKREVPTFNQAAPTAPTAPTAPQVAAFDSSGLEQRRSQLTEGLQRELGERKASRLSAVRRGDRTMLAKVKA
jgi:hypothetical protein